jgi:hypothetical protein
MGCFPKLFTSLCFRQLLEVLKTSIDVPHFVSHLINLAIAVIYHSLAMLFIIVEISLINLEFVNKKYRAGACSPAGLKLTDVDSVRVFNKLLAL